MKLTHKLITLVLAALMLVSSAGLMVFKMVCLTGEGETHVSLWEKANSCSHEKKVITKKSCCHVEEETTTQEESKPCCEFSHTYLKLDKVTTPPTHSAIQFDAVWCIVPKQFSFAAIQQDYTTKNVVSLYCKPPPNSSGKSRLIAIQTFRI